MNETPDPLIVEFEAVLLGRRCIVTRGDYDWIFDLSDGALVRTGFFWRIVQEGRIAFASGDDGHSFGLPAPLDGQAYSRELLADRAITAVRLRPETADLVLEFDTDTRIEFFNCSAGHESWRADYIMGGRRRHIIALGGGDIAAV